MMRVHTAICALLLATASPLTAQSGADNGLSCVNTGYSEVQQSVIDGFVDSFDLDQWSERGPSDELIDALRTRAIVCAQEHGWGSDDIVGSILYRLGRLITAGIAQDRADIAAADQRLKLALDAQLRERFYQIIRESTVASMRGLPSREMTDEDTDFFTEVLSRPEVNVTVGQAKLYGAYLGARLLADDIQSEFTSAATNN